MNNFGITINSVRFEIDTITEGLRELEAKLEGAPMPRMARGPNQQRFCSFPSPSSGPIESNQCRINGSQTQINWPFSVHSVSGTSKGLHFREQHLAPRSSAR
jgi:hypothetical protein